MQCKDVVEDLLGKSLGALLSKLVRCGIYPHVATLQEEVLDLLKEVEEGRGLKSSMSSRWWMFVVEVLWWIHDCWRVWNKDQVIGDTFRAKRRR